MRYHQNYFKFLIRILIDQIRILKRPNIYWWFTRNSKLSQEEKSQCWFKRKGNKPKNNQTIMLAICNAPENAIRTDSKKGENRLCVCLEKVETLKKKQYKI